MSAGAALSRSTEGGGPSPTQYGLLLALIVVVTFGAICGNDFLGWDDNLTIYQNPKFNHMVETRPGEAPPPATGPTLRDIASYWTPSGAEQGLWIPVTYTVWGILANVARLDVANADGSWLNPAIFHGASVLAHLGTTLVVFALLRRILKGRHDSAAFAGAVLYAVHPVQVEPVAWASGLKDVLCGLFALSAAYQYLCWVETKKRGHYVAGLVLFALGMLSKPTAMITPVLATILDLCVARRGWRAAARSLWPWYLLAVPCIVWTKLVQPGYGIPAIAPVYRPLLMGYDLAFYLYKLVWPAHLCIDYGKRPPVLLASGVLYYAWLAPLAVAVLIWAYRKRAPLLVPAGLLFVAGVLPVLGLTRFMFQYFSAVADHYLYISMVGAALALAWWMSRATTGAVVRAAVAVALVVLAARSVAQGFTWSDNITFFKHVIAVNPGSSMGHNNLGMTYDRLADRAKQQHDYRLWNEYEHAALAELRQSVASRPDYSKGWDNLGFLLIKVGQIDEGVAAIKRMIEAGRELPPELRGRVYMSEQMLGQYYAHKGDYAQAIRYLKEALELNPSAAEAKAALKEVTAKAREASARAATRPGASSRP